MVDFYIHFGEPLQLLSFIKERKRISKGSVQASKCVVARKRDTLPQFGTEPSVCSMIKNQNPKWIFT